MSQLLPGIISTHSRSRETAAIKVTGSENHTDTSMPVRHI